MTTEDHNIITCMKAHGSCFASAIALAALNADSTNFERIKAAFPELWDDFRELHASLVKENRTGYLP